MKLGAANKNWMFRYSIQYVTICVTEDCNLDCDYCYYVNKNQHKKLSFEKGKRIIDFLLEDDMFSDKEGLHLEFIGGEPSLEIELITKLCDYAVTKMYELNHKWLKRYLFFITTNGLKYLEPDFQSMIAKHKGHFSVVVSIDGSKTKHDLSRKTKNGMGSFDIVSRAIPLWRKQFPNNSNKATFSHSDLPYLTESILYLWKIGIHNVNAGLVFEDVWKDGDEEVFRSELTKLANYILENNLHEEYSVSFFNSNLGLPMPYLSYDTNVCGVGQSIGIDCNGNILPCHRFFECAFNVSGYEDVILGNVDEGINADRLRAFHCLSYDIIAEDKCKKCEVATGCSWCVGNNYCENKCKTIFSTVTYKCKMHKVNAEVNEYLWSKLQERQPAGTYVPYYICKMTQIGEMTKFLYIHSGYNMPQYCAYGVAKHDIEAMTSDLFAKVLHFCRENHYIPVIVGDLTTDYPHYSIRTKKMENSPFEIIVTSSDLCREIKEITNTITYNLDKSSLDKLVSNVEYLLAYCKHISINIIDLEKWEKEDLKRYELGLRNITHCMLEYRKKGIRNTINNIDDIMYRSKVLGCGAGDRCMSIFPDGRFYVCPGYYTKDGDNCIGNIKDGLEILHQERFLLSKAILCKECDRYQCRRCLYLNKKTTGQDNIPPQIQCKVSYVEKEVSLAYQRELQLMGIDDFINLIDEEYVDPIGKVYRRNHYLHSLI